MTDIIRSKKQSCLTKFNKQLVEVFNLNQGFAQEGDHLYLKRLANGLANATFTYTPIRPMRLLSKSPLFVILIFAHSAFAQLSKQSKNYVTTLLASNPTKFAYTKGNLSVTETGSLNFEIPILCPPGTGQLAPRLSFLYNSNSGNGILGRGWSLSGLSIINRVSKTKAVDGENGRVSFDDDDRLALDGQRLINVDTASSYWPASAEREYRTELNSFKQIKAFYAGNEVQRFEVRTKDGLIYYYGASGNSDSGKSYLREGKGNKIVAWLLVRVSDYNGNQIDFLYDQTALARRFIKPARIDYTSHKDKPNEFYAHILFNYNRSDFNDNRYLENLIKLDPVSKYLNGEKICYDEFLTSVVTYYDGKNFNPSNNKFRTYKIHYTQSKFNRRKVFVDFIEECSKDADCIRTSFDWQDESVITSFDSVRHDSSKIRLTEDYKVYSGDFNGDGLLDKCHIKAHGDSIRVYYGINTGGAFSDLQLFTIASPAKTRHRVVSNDFNADGTTDLLIGWLESGVWKFQVLSHKHQPETFILSKPAVSQIHEKKIDASIKESNTFLGVNDFGTSSTNGGDGLMDIFFYYYLNNEIFIHYAINKADGFSISNSQRIQGIYSNGSVRDTIPNNTPINIGDFNSDGIADLLFTWVEKNSWFSLVYLLDKNLVSNIASGATAQVGFKRENSVILYPSLEVKQTSVRTIPIDSIVRVNQIASQSFANINTSTKSVQILDVNNDASSDLLIVNQDKKGWRSFVAIGRGNGSFENPIECQIDSAEYTYMNNIGFGDFNGDGDLDICTTYSNQAGWFAKIALGLANGKFVATTKTPIRLDSSNFSYQINQPTRGIFPVENFLKGFADKCEKHLVQINRNEKVPSEIIGNASKAIEFFINKSHSANLLPTPYQGISAVNFYDNFTFIDKPKSIGENDENFKRILNVKIDTASGLHTYRRAKVTVNSNCGVTIQWAGEYQPLYEDVAYPKSMQFTFIDYWTPIIADIDGDGITDLALTTSIQPAGLHPNPLTGNVKNLVCLNLAKGLEKIQSISLANGSKTIIHYSNTIKEGAFENKPEVSFPTTFYNLPISIVKATESANGIGTMNKVFYKFKNPIYNLEGRGFLGFAKREIFSEETDHRTIIDCQIETPLILRGLLPITSQTIEVGGTRVSHDKLQNNLLQQERGIFFYHVSTRSSEKFDLRGKLVTQSTIAYEYDDYGNLVSSYTTYPNGQREVITNRYYETSDDENLSSIRRNFLDRWIIGRLLMGTIVKSGTSGEQIRRVCSFKYNDLTGQLIEERQMVGSQYEKVREISYDQRGNIITEKIFPLYAPHEFILNQFEYTDKTYYRFLESKTDALGYKTTFVVDDLFGVNRQIKNSNGNVTSIEFSTEKFDPLGRRQSIRYPDGSWAKETNYKCAKCDIAHAAYFKIIEKSYTEPTIVYYDVLDRVIQTVNFDFKGRKITSYQRYDAKGSLVEVSIPTSEIAKAPTTTYHYNQLGQVVKTINPDKSFSENKYDGLTHTYINELGQKYTTTYDLLGRKTAEQNHLTETIEYGYDLDGNVDRIEDQNGREFTFKFDDQLGKVTSKFNPNIGSPTIYNYNYWGEISKVQSGISSQNSYEIMYDKLGRVISRKEAKFQYPVGIDAPENLVEDKIYWDYILPNDSLFGKGSLKAIRVDGDHRKLSKHFSYDSLGRMSNKVLSFENFDNRAYDIPAHAQWSKVVNEPLKIQYEYNTHGQLSKVTYPRLKTVNYKKEFVVSYEYVGDVMTSVTANGNNIWSLGDVYADGSHRSSTLGRFNIYVDYSLTNQNVNEMATSLSGKNVHQFSYKYDQLGNITNRKTIAAGKIKSEEFHYDDLNRLISASEGIDSVIYRYHPGGNMSYNSELGYYNYEPSSRQFRITAEEPYGGEEQQQELSSAVVEIVSDELGNRTMRRDGPTRIYQIQYTHFNKPDYITTGGKKTSFFYDEDNNVQIEHWKNGNKDVCKFYIDGLFEFTVEDGFRVDQTFLIKVNNRVIAFNDIKNQTRADNFVFLHHDVQGNIIALSSADRILGYILYNAFGKKLTTFDHTNGFGGHTDYDKLVNFGGRLYDPSIGQFLQVDPVLNLDLPTIGLSSYSYAFNNPLFFTDPTGYWSIRKPFSGIGRGIVRALVAGPAASFLVFPEFRNFIDKNAGLIVAVQGMVISVPATAIGIPPPITGFATGFASSFAQVYLNGGTFGQAVEAGMVSGTISGVTAGIVSGIGAVYSGPNGNTPLFQNAALNETGRAFTHAAFQGAMNEAQGGSFMEGALPALLSSAVGHSGLVPNGTDLQSAMGRTAIAATIGGTVSAMNGGKFANGAMTAAMVNIFNREWTTFLAMTAGGLLATHFPKGTNMQLSKEGFNEFVSKAERSGGYCDINGNYYESANLYGTEYAYFTGRGTFCIDKVDGMPIGYYDSYNCTGDVNKPDRPFPGNAATWLCSKFAGKNEGYTIRYNNCQPPE